MPTKAELSLKVKELKTKLSAIETDTKIVDFIYPNVEKFVQWDKLKYSLRSLEKNLIDIEFRIWIVGDRPEWLNNEAHFIDVPCSGKTTRLDQAIKRIAVDNHPEINETYFWMNDDIFFVNPVTYADLCIPKTLGNLRNRMNQYNPQTTWGADMHSTFRKLKLDNLPTLNYAIHVPYMYEKTKSIELFRIFNLNETPLVFENLYYNLFYSHLIPYNVSLEESNNLLFCINRPNPNWNTIATQLKCKKFMNNSEAGMTEKFKILLKSLFPEKSRFEI